jgi:P-type Ca2+ transporter type 2C
LHAGALVADHPFDPVGKYVTHVWRMGDGSCRVAAKGSAETLAANAMTEVHDRLAARGMRVIAVSAGTLPGPPTGDRARDEAPLRLVGLVAFEDPLRERVADALAECRAAGIRVVMITGDHPATAHAVVEGLGLPHEGGDGADLIVTGDEIDAASDDRLDSIVARANVFARTRPEQKHRLVGALRRRGEVVAMTGDGINDAPALREADIGIAMGERGTAVAREAATMVLLDDNFATIVAAVRVGRRVFDSLHRAFVYLIAFHPPLLIAALVLPLLNRPLLLLPAHLVLLQLLLQPIVSLVFEMDPPDADLMTRPPRDPKRGLLGAEAIRPVLLGTTLATAVVASYLIALRSWPVTEARAFGFVVLLAGQLLLLLVARGFRRRPTRVFVAVVAVFTMVMVATVEVHPLAHVLELSAFPAAGWLLAVVIAAAATMWSHALPSRTGRAPHRGRSALSRADGGVEARL